MAGAELWAVPWTPPPPTTACMQLGWGGCCCPPSPPPLRQCSGQGCPRSTVLEGLFFTEHSLYRPPVNPQLLAVTCHNCVK